MSKILTNRWVTLFILLVLLFLCFGFIDHDNHLRQRAQMIVFDHYLKEYPRQSSGQVLIIDIDDESLQKQGQWPWSRKVFADMIKNLNHMGASIIAFDGVLAEPDRTSPENILNSLDANAKTKLLNEYQQFSLNYDEMLAQELENYGRFVSGFTHGISNEKPIIKQRFLVKNNDREHFLKSAYQFRNVAKFIPVLERSAAGNGSFMATADVDNIIRRTSHIFRTSKEQELFPSLSLEIVRLLHKYKNGENINPQIKRTEIKGPINFQQDYEVMIGEYKVPISSEGKMWIHYRKHDLDRNYISAYKILENTISTELQDKVKDKVVIIASSAEGLKDLRSTPLGLLPGVEVHLNATEQILSGDFLNRSVGIQDAENLYILFWGLCLIALTFFLGINYLFLITLSSTGLVILASYFGFQNHGVLIDPVYPSFSIGLIFVVASLLKYIRSESERRQIKGAFGLYVSPDFMDELTKHPDKLKLGGEVKDLTVMFTDIRSFTTISESLTPEELIQLMNDFLTPMSDLVMENRGTIDKYMGDAMMAFWNAPLDDPDHARNACKVALQMNEALVPINERVKAKAEEEGRVPVLLNAGIGINTGPCSVGNMGSKQRFAYSALGDAVNLASRMEGQTKAYGVHILIGEDTQKAIPDFAAPELDLIQVKGKTQPVKIFTLLGDETMAERADYQTWVKAHNAMLAAYRAGDFDCAAQDLADARKLGNKVQDGMLNYYYDMYMDRIAQMIKTPPTENWDGVFVATSK